MAVAVTARTISIESSLFICAVSANISNSKLLNNIFGETRPNRHAHTHIDTQQTTNMNGFGLWLGCVSSVVMLLLFYGLHWIIRFPYIQRETTGGSDVANTRTYSICLCTTSLRSLTLSLSFSSFAFTLMAKGRQRQLRATAMRTLTTTDDEKDKVFSLIK